jgi:hypothetical protein
MDYVPNEELPRVTAATARRSRWLARIWAKRRRFDNELDDLLLQEALQASAPQTNVIVLND